MTKGVKAIKTWESLTSASKNTNAESADTESYTVFNYRLATYVRLLIKNEKSSFITKIGLEIPTANF